MPIQKDIDLLLSQEIEVNIRLTLLDDNFVPIEEIQGKAISFSASISATSDIRRTASFTMYVSNKSYIAASGELIWLDRIIRAEIGLRNDEVEEFTWYLIGSFLIQDNTYEYNETTQNLTMGLLDPMAATTDALGSQIGGAPIQIPYESNARGALISTVARFSPFKFYDADELPDVIPYDLEFNLGVYPHEVLKMILDLFPYYQMYYSPTGVFTVKPIPTGIGDPLALDETVMDKLILAEGESRRNSLSPVKNVTEIWGRSLDAGYFAEECISNGNTYELFVSDTFETLEPNATFMLIPDTTSSVGQKIKIQDIEAYPVYIQAGNGTETALVSGAMESGVPYVVRYLDGKYYLQGEADIHVICMEVANEPSPAKKEQDKIDNNCRVINYVVNPDSPFTVDKIGERRRVLSDGEYADIYTTQLAVERAAYENWKTTRLQDTVELHCVLIPFLDVNQKISYTSPLTGEVKQYLVQEISLDVATFTMTLTLMQFYPAFPWL